jgi:hypothetical protein
MLSNLFADSVQSFYSAPGGYGGVLRLQPRAARSRSSSTRHRTLDVAIDVRVAAALSHFGCDLGRNIL